MDEETKRVGGEARETASGGERVPYTYIPKSVAELKQLALDVVEGRVFGSWSVPEDEVRMLMSIFLPLALCEKEHLKDLVDQNITGFYEYLDKSNSMAVNGYPTFMTVKMLNSADLGRLYPMIEQLIKQRREFMQS